MDEPIGPRAYHERTKHRLQGYARGPETLDWSAPPDPFRTFDGAPRVVLPLSAEGLTRPLRALDHGVAPCREPSLESVGALFELTFAISAWKRQGPDLWAVRCHPSSGNLHPTEAYLIAHGFASLPDGTQLDLDRVRGCMASSAECFGLLRNRRGRYARVGAAACASDVDTRRAAINSDDAPEERAAR